MKINPEWQAAEDIRLALEEEYKSVLLTWKADREAAEKAIELARKMFVDADAALNKFTAKIEAANQKVRDIQREIEE